MRGGKQVADSANTSGSPQPNRLFTEVRFREHLGLLAGAGLVIAFALKVLVSAKFDVQTAVAVLQSVEVAQHAAGILTSVIVDALLMVALVTLISIRTAWGTMWQHWILVAACFFLPWVIACVIAALWILVPLVTRRISEQRVRHFQRLVLPLLIVLPIVHRGMWIPPERIDFQDGRTETAYVIDFAPDVRFATLLTERTRTIKMVKTSLIADRQVCDIRTHARWDERLLYRHLSLMQLLAFRPAPSYPACPAT
jgi:hypothetical protein